MVERFDRKLSRVGTVERFHQEDFCQALSILPDTKVSQNLLTKELTLMAQKTVMEAGKLHAEAEQLEFMHPVLDDILRIIKSRASRIQQFAG